MSDDSDIFFRVYIHLIAEPIQVYHTGSPSSVKPIR